MPATQEFEDILSMWHPQIIPPIYLSLSFDILYFEIENWKKSVQQTWNFQLENVKNQVQIDGGLSIY